MITYLFLIDFTLLHCINRSNLILSGRLVSSCFSVGSTYLYVSSVIQCIVASQYQYEKTFHISTLQERKSHTFCERASVFVMATALYLLYIMTTLSRLTIVSREAKKKQAVRDE